MTCIYIIIDTFDHLYIYVIVFIYIYNNNYLGGERNGDIRNKKETEETSV